MLQYFESFNTMARIDVGLDGGGDQDTAPYWSNPTYARHRFVDGPTGHGQAIRVYETMRYSFNTTTYPLMGIGANVKLFANTSGNQDGYIFSIGIGETYDASPGLVSLFVNSSGGIQVRWENVAVGSLHANAVSTSEWNHIQLEADSANDVIKLWRNGSLLETITGAGVGGWIGFNGGVHIGRIPAGLNIIRYDIGLDDVFIYDTETLTDETAGSEILGTLIGATHDRYENTSLTGFLGTMIIDGDRYESASAYANIESETYDPGKNVASKLHYNFFTDPSTSLPWTNIDRIEHWGVCCVPDGSNHTARLCNMTLEALHWNDGEPWVKTTKPGPAAYFSGPWVKSDPTLPYYAHVNKVPRDAELEYDDTTSLFIDDYGCMLYEPRFPPDDEPEPLGEIGITFAEERRTDYADWVDLLGGPGQDYESYFISGYSLAGQSDKFFANNYLTVNFNNVEDGAGYVQGIWDFANSNQSSRWSMRQKLYGPVRTVTGFYTHGERKLLIRGNGRAMQVRVSSQSGHPFKVNGWAMYITGNSKA